MQVQANNFIAVNLSDSFDSDCKHTHVLFVHFKIIGLSYGLPHFVIAVAVWLGLHVSLFSCRETGSVCITPAIWYRSLTAALQLAAKVHFWQSVAVVPFCVYSHCKLRLKDSLKKIYCKNTTATYMCKYFMHWVLHSFTKFSNQC